MAKGKKRPAELPEYGTVMMKGVQYYRTRITDADGKRVAIYGLTREELYDRVENAQKKIAEVVFHRENPTVEEYLKCSPSGVERRYSQSLRLYQYSKNG